MAKKFVRGITDVKTITNQDFDTNNVNDLLSDGQYNYIHRKKGKNEEYHNLTDNIKTLSSDNTELLSVTNYNKTTNTALLSPKHDKQKEQVLESTRDTITIHHGTNATAEKTTVDTNPQKVLEHENLISNSQYVTIEHEQDSNTTEIKTDNLVSKLDELNNKIPTSAGGRNLALGTSGDWCTGWSNFNGENNQTHTLYRVYNRGLKIGDKINIRIVFKYSNIVAAEGQTASGIAKCPGNVTNWGSGRLDCGGSFNFDGGSGEIELKATTVVDESVLENEYWNWHLRVDYVKSGKIQWKEAKAEVGDLPTSWTPAPEDIYHLLAQKQDTLVAGTGITIQGNTISASGGSFIEILENSETITAIEHVETTGNKTIKTFSFEISGDSTVAINGKLRSELSPFIPLNSKVTSGTLAITTDNKNMFLSKSASSDDRQQATFSFLTINESGGEGGGSHV